MWDGTVHRQPTPVRSVRCSPRGYLAAGNSVISPRHPACAALAAKPARWILTCPGSCCVCAPGNLNQKIQIDPGKAWVYLPRSRLVYRSSAGWQPDHACLRTCSAQPDRAAAWSRYARTGCICRLSPVGVSAKTCQDPRLNLSAAAGPAWSMQNHRNFKDQNSPPRESPA